MASRGGIPDILVVCFIASMLGVVFLVFVQGLLWFAVGDVAGEGRNYLDMSFVQIKRCN